jgi:putative nucleotidyltransferase with HDIG domain
MGIMKPLLSKIIDYIENIPIISSVPMQLLTKISSDDFNINHIVKLIEMDVSLSARCLQVVNSAAFGQSREITSIKQALVLLGNKTLIQIALLQGFGKVLSKKLTGYEADKRAFWNHSIRTGIASRIFSIQHTNETQPDLLYTAGLLHDIGKVVTSDFLELVDKEISEKLLNDESESFLEIERSLLETDHTEVGEWMAKKWNFPEVLQNVVRFHHTPLLADEKYRRIVEIVHIGDILAMMGGSGTGTDSMLYSFDQNVYNDLNLGAIDLTSLIFEIDMEYLNMIEKLDTNFAEEKVK